MNKWKRKGKGEIKGGEADLDSWGWSGVKERGLFCSLLGGSGPEQLMASPQLSRAQKPPTSFKCLPWHSFHEGRLLVLSMCVLRTGFILFNFISFVQQIFFFSWMLDNWKTNNLLISSHNVTADVQFSSMCVCVYDQKEKWSWVSAKIRMNLGFWKH